MRTPTLGILPWVLLLGAAEAALRPVAGAVLLRDQLVQEVLERNPDLAAALATERAAAARSETSGTYEQPMVSYAIAPLTLSGMRFGQEFEIRQALPLSGSRSLRTALASADADAGRFAREVLRLDLALETSQLFDDYWLVERALESNDEHLRLLEEFRRIATARYAASTAPQQDPIQAEVEQAHLLHRDATLKAERAVTVARLNALLHRSPDNPLPAPPAELPLPLDHDVDLEESMRRALAERPELGAADAEIAARTSALDLARRAGKPDLEAMGSYSSMWDEREHRFMIGVGVRVPLWRKSVEAGVAEAHADLDRVEARRTALDDAVRAQVYTARTRIAEAQHVAELYRSRLLPASSDQVQAALSGFRTGQSGFLSLIEAERNQRTVEFNYLQALSDLSRRHSELARALGQLPGFTIAVDTPANGEAPPAPSESAP